MQKIFIVGKQDWKTNDRKTGEEIRGVAYIGYLPNGIPIKFTSKEDYIVYAGEIQYDATRAIEVPLLTKLFEGKISYQDGKSYGKNPDEEDND